MDSTAPEESTTTVMPGGMTVTATLESSGFLHDSAHEGKSGKGTVLDASDVSSGDVALSPAVTAAEIAVDDRLSGD